MPRRHKTATADVDGRFTIPQEDLENHRPNPHTIDYDFLNKAKSRFPTVTSAITALRQISSPPSSIPDPSRPSTQVEDVLMIFASLGAYVEIYGPTAYLQVKANWVNLIGPWVRYLIEGFVLVKEGPSTLEGVEACRQSLSFIPLLLHRRKALKRKTEYKELRRMDRYLYPLFVQVWLKLIDECHPTWMVWVNDVAELRQATTERGLFVDADLVRYAPYKDATSSQLGMLYVRHINHLASIGCSAPWHNISAFRCHLWLMWHNLGGKDQYPPLFQPDVLRYSVPALANLATCFLHRRKMAQAEDWADIDYVRSSEGGTASDLVDHTLNLLHLSIRGFEIAVIDAGTLLAFFKASPSYYRAHREQKENTDLPVRFQEILGDISRMAVYPSVLRRFLLVLKRVERSEKMQARTEKRWSGLWKDWERAKQKAIALRDLRDSVKMRRISLCDYSQCPLLNEEVSQGVLETAHITYLRCSACCRVIYCSRECRSMDWRKEHKAQCSALTKLRLAGDFKAPISRHDALFFRECVQFVMQRNSQSISTEIRDYLSKLSQHRGKLSEDARLMKTGCKNPFLLLDFVTAELDLPKPEVLDPATLVTRVKMEMTENASWTTSMIQKWRDAGIGKGNILVVALFPQNEFDPWSLDEIYEFPIRTGALPYFEDEDDILD
ncbi:hypothetical protein V5O48_006436 [Marasmius crinis-equi]|uniref:MYND-type domain-containing protein n=1 Tax=Marasmius crinis-equi TaxID=585013 RepID=A0ABR3FJJ2_9AGAR